MANECELAIAMGLSMQKANTEASSVMTLSYSSLHSVFLPSLSLLLKFSSKASSLHTRPILEELRIYRQYLSEPYNSFTFVSWTTTFFGLPKKQLGSLS